MKKSKPRAPAKIPFFVYCDESGHTGDHLFDSNQPYFYTGALISSNNLDKTAAKPYQDWLIRLAVSELHGQNLGIDGISKIGGDLINILKQNNCYFVLTVLEKRYYAAISLAWIILDSDFNRGVGDYHSHTSLFHRMLAINILQALKPSEVQEFWSLYAKRDLPGFVRILDNLRLRIYETFPDKRGRELLLDALGWASSHPAEVLRAKRTSRESINVFALFYILDGIREATQNKGIGYRFVHDEQKQFAKSLQDAYELAKDMRVSEREPILGTMELDRDPIATCPIEFVASITSIGVQLADTLLWLKKRELEVGGKFPEECKALLDFLKQREVIRTFFYEELKQRTLAEYSMVMSMPITQEQGAKGKAFAAEMEKKRLKRISSSND